MRFHEGHWRETLTHTQNSYFERWRARQPKAPLALSTYAGGGAVVLLGESAQASGEALEPKDIHEQRVETEKRKKK